MSYVGAAVVGFLVGLIILLFGWGLGLAMACQVMFRDTGEKVRYQVAARIANKILEEREAAMRRPHSGANN